MGWGMRVETAWTFILSAFNLLSLSISASAATWLLCGRRGATRHRRPAALVFSKSQVLRQCAQNVKGSLWAADRGDGMHPNWWPGLLASSFFSEALCRIKKSQMD